MAHAPRPCSLRRWNIDRSWILLPELTPLDMQLVPKDTVGLGDQEKEDQAWE